MHSHENAGDGVLFSAVADMQAYSFSKRESITDAFLDSCEVLQNIILQKNAAGLLLIFCNIFNVSLALSVINQSRHSMEI